MLVTIAAVSAVAAIVVLGLYLSGPDHEPTATIKAKDVSRSFRSPAPGAAEIWMTKSEGRLRNQQEQIRQMQLEIKQLHEKAKTEASTAAAPVTAIDAGQQSLPPPPPPTPTQGAAPPPSPSPTPEASPAFPSPALLPPPPGGAPASSNNTAGNEPSPSIMEVNLSPASATSGPSEAKAQIDTIRTTIPTGTFVGAVLLDGLDAPTGGLARTNPIPVLMRLVNDGTLPNRMRSRVRDCFVTGAGYGDLSAERAYIRLENLSCVLRHGGQIIDTPVEGYIAGEDGKAGFRGHVISKQGQVIAQALFTGILGGIGNSISQSFSTISTSPLGAVQTVNPQDVVKVGVASGFGNALEKIADFYIARANELYPVIEVDSARHGDIVFTKKVEMGKLFGKFWRQSDDD
jgi:Bacterial conjugation TrbI-like protein.